MNSRRQQMIRELNFVPVDFALVDLEHKSSCSKLHTVKQDKTTSRNITARTQPSDCKITINISKKGCSIIHESLLFKKAFVTSVCLFVYFCSAGTVSSSESPPCDLIVLFTSGFLHLHDSIFRQSPSEIARQKPEPNCLG